MFRIPLFGESDNTEDKLRSVGTTANTASIPPVGMKVDCNSRGKLEFIHGSLHQQMSSTYERLNSSYPTSPNQPPVTNFQSLYKLKGLLGQGAFGVVLLVFNKHTEEESALKIINKSRLSSDAMEFLANEAHILKTLSYPPKTADNEWNGHQMIAKFKQIFDTPTYIFIEMEYVPGGLLKKLFKRSKAMSDTEAKLIVKNILEGVCYIHERGYMHRDLKPENILMCETPPHSYQQENGVQQSFDLKIVDFGLSVEHKNGPISLH